MTGKRPDDFSENLCYDITIETHPERAAGSTGGFVLAFRLPPYRLKAV